MTIGEALRAHVLGDMAIAARVSERMYPLRLIEKPVMPSIVYQRITERRDQHLRGVGSLTAALYQFDAWGKTHDDAISLGELLRARLDGFEGVITDTSSPAVDVHVQAILFDDARDVFEEDILGGLCRHSADYRVFYRSGTFN